MKNIIKSILSLFLALIIGCSITNGNSRTDSSANNSSQGQNNGLFDVRVRPFVNKTIKDENINIGIPIYKF